MPILRERVEFRYDERSRRVLIPLNLGPDIRGVKTESRSKRKVGNGIGGITSEGYR